LSTLAAPETWTGELIVVLASGLSMMIFPPPGIGVAAVVGSAELAGAGLAPLEGEAFADEEAADGDPLSSTKVVVLSPPHPASAADATPTTSTTPNPFNTLSKRLSAATVTPDPSPVSGRAHYSSRACSLPSGD
jgi:hypothetical protein